MPDFVSSVVLYSEKQFNTSFESATQACFVLYMVILAKGQE